MGGISRTGTRIAIISMALFVILLVLGRIIWNAYLMAASILFLTVWFILFLTINRCPHCGEYFRGLYWSEPTAGYCKKCGKLMEFDDSIK